MGIPGMSVNRAQLRRAFALTVRRLRNERGLAQEELALLSGIDRSYMGRIERGIHAPTVWTIYQITAGLKMSFHCFAKHFEESLEIVQEKTWKRKSPKD